MKKEYIHFRIEPEVKEKANTKAKKQSTTLSSLIRGWIDRYVKTK